MIVLWAGVLPLIALAGVLAPRLSTAVEALRELANLACKALFSFCASDKEVDSWSARACVLARSASRVMISFSRDAESFESAFWVASSFFSETMRSFAAVDYQYSRRGGQERDVTFCICL